MTISDTLSAAHSTLAQEENFDARNLLQKKKRKKKKANESGADELIKGTPRPRVNKVLGAPKPEELTAFLLLLSSLASVSINFSFPQTDPSSSVHGDSLLIMVSGELN